MRKVLFVFAAGAALAMVSCSKDETSSLNTGDGIAFRSAMGTRAQETTINNLESFKVTALTDTGTPYFTDAVFTKQSVSGTTGSFTSDPVYYWPATGSLSFYAYAPSTLSGVTIDNTTKSVTVTPSTTIADQIDFITANANGNKSDNEGAGVPLEFKHRLSQIEVKAKNTNNAYIYLVKGVKIGSVASSGTFDFSNSSWQQGNEKTDYKVEYNTAITLDDNAQTIMTKISEVADNAMLIPQTLSKWDPSTDPTNTNGNSFLSVLVNIKTKDGAQVYPETADAYGWAAVGINTTWAENTKYIYTLDFSKGAGNVDPDEEHGGDEIFGEPIIFDVTVKGWEPADPQPDDVEM
ncbi:fimbrillin family protein [Alistipes sp. CHKCI003]|uniref:fimbrillin family protein n=1 Tax=Alistipes sp. CHKCI003 TaxID=1780376 RepID=UPI0007A9269F|nr:fimbrillin family protein [Alistipes sp. CHKCI003]CVI72368.1 hypothetical protein BN3659_02482 [Alistipes sp. CHKCI003]